MYLVKAGRYTINFEHVAAFVEEEDRVRVIFNFSSDEEGAHSLDLDAEASEEVRAWLQKNAEGLRLGATGFEF